jgi:hypothetical protein
MVATAAAAIAGTCATLALAIGFSRLVVQKAPSNAADHGS